MKGPITTIPLFRTKKDLKDAIASGARVIVYKKKGGDMVDSTCVLEFEKSKATVKLDSSNQIVEVLK